MAQSEFQAWRADAEKLIAWRLAIHPRIAELRLRKRLGYIDPELSLDAKIGRLAHAVAELNDHPPANGKDQSEAYAQYRTERLQGRAA